MAKEYVKSGASLVDVSGDKIRNFACLEDVRAAILAGELAEGDMFTTICQTTGQTEDIAREVCRIASYIPDDTSPTNQLMNHSDFAQIESDIECRVQCCDFTDYTTANDACMACRVQCCDFTDYTTANDTAVSCRVQCSDFNDFVTNINSYVSDRVCCSDYTSGMATKVDCTDYQTCCSAWDSAISTLQGKAGLDCVGTVTGITVNGTACPATSGVVAITDVASASTLSTLSGTVSDLSTCPGLSCTGTLVPSDLNTINSDIADLKTCPGLSCTGTVVASDIANFITMADVNACGYTTCTGTLTSSDIANFITMSDVNACGFTTCTGTLTSSDLDSYATKSCVCTIVNGIFSLSGNVLTITSA